MYKSSTGSLIKITYRVHAMPLYVDRHVYTVSERNHSRIYGLPALGTCLTWHKPLETAPTIVPLPNTTTGKEQKKKKGNGEGRSSPGNCQKALDSPPFNIGSTTLLYSSRVAEVPNDNSKRPLTFVPQRLHLRATQYPFAFFSFLSLEFQLACQ